MRMHRFVMVFALAAGGVSACGGTESPQVNQGASGGPGDASVEAESAAGGEASAEADASACTEGAKKCNGNATRTCAKGKWLDASECEESACVNGESVGVCVPATNKCDANAPQTCSAVGEWQAEQACVHQTCVNGVCQGVCAPAEVSCIANAPQTCDPVGNWADTTACVHQTCVGGACQGECAPDEGTCEGNVPVTCDPQGAWLSGAECVSPELCCKGACVPGIVEIALGGEHSCVRKSDGSVWCWGANNTGQLGDGTTSPTVVPQRVTAVSNIERLAAGQLHTCARKNDGTLWCWGWNDLGQLGVGIGGETCGGGTGFCRLSPTQVAVLNDVTFVTCGEGTCAGRSDGTLWCWGRDDDGQVGNGPATGGPCGLPFDCEPEPVQVVGLSGVQGAAVGTARACARDAAGMVWCWGANWTGELGTGSTGVPEPAPVQASGLSDVVALAAGASHTCARRSDGTVWCWGGCWGGQLGTGSTTCKACNGGESCEPAPVQVTALGTSVVGLAAGFEHTCVVKADLTVSCWGINRYGQLGNGTVTGMPCGGLPCEPSPAQVSMLGGDVVSISSGSAHSCARKKDGTVWCWGRNTHGQLGDGTTTGVSCGFLGGNEVCKPTPVQALVSCQ
jgi:alpha-tubulin suppressor-like RCC1 family protein